MLDEKVNHFDERAGMVDRALTSKLDIGRAFGGSLSQENSDSNAILQEL